MEGIHFQFEGLPCFQHTNYVFFKAFKYVRDGKKRILLEGDFFFLKILEELPICIGEVELLWEDKASNQLFASLRLYFRPEHTPEGRQNDFGEDEVLALGERLVVRLDDLVPLIQHDVKWTYGSSARSVGGQDSQSNGIDKKPDVSEIAVKTEKDGELEPAKDEKEVKESKETKVDYLSNGAANIAVMSYAKYCRYRAVRQRLEGCENEWLHQAIVMAIGGFPGRAPGCKVMFCRDTFYHSDIDDLDIRMDHMLPMLKKASKSKKSKQLIRKDSQQDSDSMEELFANITPSISTSSRPRRQTDSGDISEDKVSTEEQDFLIGLHKFMHDSQMPIGRIPSLGFKQNLYYFYKQAQKLGGYDMITTKRMWKHLYDKLGGNSSNTSAATCTRRHYERLLLPYERHLRKVKGMKRKKKHEHGEPDGSSHKDSVTIKAVDEVKEEITPLRRQGIDKLLDHTPIKVEGEKGNDVLEIPAIKSRLPGGTNGSDMKSSDGLKLATKAEDQQLMRDHYADSKSKGGLGGVPTPSPLASVSGESSMMSYPNLMYRGGYLLPVLPPMLQSPWAALAQSTSVSSTPGMHGLGEAAANQTKELLSSAFMSRTPHKPKSNQGIGSSGSPSGASMSASSSGKKPSFAHSQKANSSSPSVSALKTAHTNTPYTPAPYLLEDHIQPATRVLNRGIPGFPHASDLLGHTSHSLAPLLHPTPPGHKTPANLPPAPTSLYLHPSSTNPFSPLPSPLSEPPPKAHQARKRVYPFDNGSMGFTSVFPSPDMVLDRIRNSTGEKGLPHPPVLPRAPAMQQRFDNPRDIFHQTPQTFATAAASNSSRRQVASAFQDSRNKHSSSRAKVSPSPSSSSSIPSSVTVPSPHRNSQLFSPFGSLLPGQNLSALELQQTLLQHPQALAGITPGVSGSSSSGRNSEKAKTFPSSNGMLTSPSGKAGTSSQPSPLAASGKDGRLTSALFGTQFTAVPRSAKGTDSSSTAESSTSAAAAAAAAMGLPPHLHPAFMSAAAYLPPVTSSPAGSVNPGLQMFAGPYGTTQAAQLAAYEDLLRQSGFGAFLAAGGPPPAKAAKKS